MKPIATLCLALALLAGAAPAPAPAADKDPLFVNLTTDEPHRANMGITFGGRQHERGHPLTIFLNDKAVLIGSRAHGARFGEHQQQLLALVAKGANVLVCPMCMKHYGVKDSDLLPGLKVGNPDLTGSLLFRDGTRTLSW